VEERVPERTQQETLRALGDEELRQIVDRYVDAWERCDVEAFASMLAEDATFAMPPLASWYSGRDGISIWARSWPLSGAWRWKTVFVRANGQPALGFYAWDEEEGAYVPFALNVMSFRGREISAVVAFVARSIQETENEVYERWPEQPVDAIRLAGTFESFGLPGRLE
jgi:RNA polymerase sigma-70 factor, ECF subfamily